MSLPDISLVLKVSARLVDLHDSRRNYGESPNYQGDVRSGHGDGRYVAMATHCLDKLHDFGRRSGDEYTSLATLTQALRVELPWTQEVDVEYVLNVLSRPTELKLLLLDGGVDGHVITEKDTNLVEKSPNVAEFRLSWVGRRVLSMATNLDDEYQDIAYIEGDVTKLIRALENGKLRPALNFVEQLNDQLRVAHALLVSLIERGGRGLREAYSEMAGHTELMSRANELVKIADAKINEILRTDRDIDDEDVPIGLVRERVRELSRGIVRYSRQLSQLSAEISRGISSSVDAPSFAELARHWVKQQPSEARLNQIMSVMGPSEVKGILAMGTDYEGTIRSRTVVERLPETVDLSEYAEPQEHEFTRWLTANRAIIEQRIRDGGLSLEAAIADGLATMETDEAFGCLVTALSALESWTDLDGLILTLTDELSKAQLPALEVMFSGLTITQRSSINSTKDSR